MSHQGYEGWFPECFVCGMGNLTGVICLIPLQDEHHGLTPIRGKVSGPSEFVQENGHWWKGCLVCDTRTLSDPFSWGSLTYCIECWNGFVERGVYPPASAVEARRMTPEQWGARPH